MKKEKDFARAFPPGSGIGVGIAIGAGIGILMGNLPLGIGVGIAIGAGLDGAAYASKDRDTKDN